MSQLVTHTSTLHQGRQLNKLQDLARHEVCTQCLKIEYLGLFIYFTFHTRLRAF